MTRIAYTAHITDPTTKLVLIPDVDCEVEATTDMDSGMPLVSAVYVDASKPGDWRNTTSVELLASPDAGPRWLGEVIKSAAERCDWLAERVQEEEGVQYRGRGGNDPDGHFVRLHHRDPDHAYDMRRDEAMELAS